MRDRLNAKSNTASRFAHSHLSFPSKWQHGISIFAWRHSVGTFHVGRLSRSARMALAATGNHTCRWNRSSPGARASDVATLACITSGIWPTHRDTVLLNTSFNLAESRLSIGRLKVLDIPALQDRCSVAGGTRVMKRTSAWQKLK